MTDTKQPEALRLAEWLETSPYHHDKLVAAELRRLHEVNAELLEALKVLVENDMPAEYMFYNARAAIAKAEGSK
jgi:hypothetical protein